MTSLSSILLRASETASPTLIPAFFNSSAAARNLGFSLMLEVNLANTNQRQHKQKTGINLPEPSRMQLWPVSWLLSPGTYPHHPVIVSRSPAALCFSSTRPSALPQKSEMVILGFHSAMLMKNEMQLVVG
jgi:hypothetical protein